jgi:hypothetical protein
MTHPTAKEKVRHCENYRENYRQKSVKEAAAQG